MKSTSPLNEGTQLRQKIEERMGIAPKFYVYIKDPLNNIDTVMQLIATAERAAVNTELYNLLTHEDTAFVYRGPYLKSNEQFVHTNVIRDRLSKLSQGEVIEDNSNNPEASTDSASFPTLILQAEIRGACDAIEHFTDLLVDEGPENFLAIKYKLIAELEKKR